MPIQMLRCRKHGIVKHHIGATCELCTSESKEALTKAPNKQSKPCFFENEHKRYKREYLAYCAHCGIKL